MDTCHAHANLEGHVYQKLVTFFSLPNNKGNTESTYVPYCKHNSDKTNDSWKFFSCRYEKSYMHRDVVTHVAVSPAEFFVTGSADGMLMLFLFSG